MRSVYREMKSREIKLTDDETDSVFGKTKEEQIMEFIEKNDGVTNAQICRKFKEPETNVRRFLQVLLDYGRVKKEKCKCGQGNLFTIESTTQKRKK